MLIFDENFNNIDIEKPVELQLAKRNWEIELAKKTGLPLVNDNEIMTGKILSVDFQAESLTFSIPSSHATVNEEVLFLQFHSIDLIKNKMAQKLGSDEPEEEKNMNYVSSQGPSAIDLELLEKKERLALETAKNAIKKLGKGVSHEAQEIFDALNKTMPCEWEHKNILVLGEVLVKPPYSQDSCFSENEAGLTRVKKVLEGEKRKLLSKKLKARFTRN